MQTGRIDNPYLDPDRADQVRRKNFEGAKAKALQANQKEVVLVKNHDHVLPMEKGKKVCIVVLSGDNPAAGILANMGVGNGGKITDQDEGTRNALSALLTEKGYQILQDPAVP